LPKRGECAPFLKPFGVSELGKNVFLSERLGIDKLTKKKGASIIENYLLRFQGNTLTRWSIFHCLMWLVKDIAPPYNLLYFILRIRRKQKGLHDYERTHLYH
jgi:hypothetical protein